jgi:hypothetical protein
MALAVNIVVIWDVMPCIFIDVYYLQLVSFSDCKHICGMFLLLSLTFLLAHMFTSLLYRLVLSRNNV